MWQIRLKAFVDVAVRVNFTYKGFFNESATKVFLNKTKMVLAINEILYSCKSTFDAIMNETGFV